MGDAPAQDLQSQVGYDFGDEQTREELELIDDLQKLGLSQYIDLPQLVVVGDQSTGKSSILRAVTEIPFDVNEGMCTRFATEIHLKRTPPGQSTTVSVTIKPDAKGSLERRRLLSEWQPQDIKNINILSAETMKSIFKQAEDAIFGTSSIPVSGDLREPTGRISNSVLRIDRSGPHETNFAIIDIPGLIRDNGKMYRGQSEHNIIKKLVDRYLNNSKSLVVAVMDLNVDLERQGIREILATLPDAKSRVIGVATKCDLYAGASWGFNLIRNDDPKAESYLEEGWYGLRNRSQAEIKADISDTERDKLEDDFFAGRQWRDLPQDKLGRHNLKKALIKMRNKHIKRSIPKLVNEIDRVLSVCLQNISALGPSRLTSNEQYVLLTKIATKYSRMSEGALRGHYWETTDLNMRARKLIRDDLDALRSAMQEKGLLYPFRDEREDAKVLETNPDPEVWQKRLLEIDTYEWIQKAMKEYRAIEFDNEVNLDVRERLWLEQIANWPKISFAALRQAENTVSLVNGALFREACPDTDLRANIQKWLQDEFSRAVKDAELELQRLIDDEREAQLLTLHPWRSFRQTEIDKSRAFEFTTKMSARWARKELLEIEPKISKDDKIKLTFIMESLLRQEPLLGVLTIHDSLKAYSEVATYRFIDNVALQVIERHLLGAKGPLRIFTPEYVSQKLYGKENEELLSSIAGEKPEVRRQREELEAQKTSLEESMKRVQAFRLL
ncbi:P-loop containing nucleoside triphosphate hydrolase protein [Xylogone sp. PMI_703]|nr:P-loop containing nucleoside triphosphate hydrolase protein [Xylogone sp. PMI_703]